MEMQWRRKDIFMEELKNYLCKNNKDRIVLAIAGAVFGALGVVVMLRKDGLMDTILSVVFLLGFAILVFEALTSASREKRKMQELEDSGVLSQAAAEFADAESFANDTLRLGRTYIFRKKYTTLLQYRVIKQVATAVRTDDDTHSTEISFYAKLSDGTEQKLCSTGDFGEAALIKERIKAHDPEITVK